MAATTVLRILDEATGKEVMRCTGPAPDGSCPRVEIGDILPCSGHALAQASAGDDAPTYDVPGQATLCPLTVAAALAVPPDTYLIPEE